LAKIYDIKQRTYDFSIEMIRFLDKLPTDYVSQTIGKQLLRSATSIGANIMEAKSASSKRDFVNYYSYSLKSANESKYWLNLLVDSGKMSAALSRGIIDECTQLSNIIAASIIRLRATNKSGKE